MKRLFGINLLILSVACLGAFAQGGASGKDGGGGIVPPPPTNVAPGTILLRESFPPVRWDIVRAAGMARCYRDNFIVKASN